MAKEYDAIIVGSGAGGAPVAYKLAKAGLKVLVLERGPHYSIEDFTHDEVAICRRDFWYPWSAYDPHTYRRQEKQRALPTRSAWTSHCVGGATVHMSGFFYRAKDCDLTLASRLGPMEGASLADWPIDLQTLSPFYDEMEVLIGVSGQAGINPFEERLRPFPLPPLKAHPLAGVIDQAAQARAWHAYPTPRAVLSQSYGDRPPCTLCGFCGDYGCENDSKSSTLATLIPMALATGNCELRPKAMVSRILSDAKKVLGVRYFDEQGQVQEVRAARVVLAASALESARLLLLSENSHFPQGLANRSGLVGKNLSFSTFGKASAIFNRGDLESLGEGLHRAFLQRSVQDDYWNHDLPAFPKGGTYNFIRAHPNPINNAVRVVAFADYGLWGDALSQRLERRFKEEQWFEAEIFGEYLPNPGTFVDLDPHTRDPWGLPVARITERAHPKALENNRAMVERAKALFEACDPKPERVFASAAAGTTYHLQHGTCRFGEDPSTSVLNPQCQSHDLSGLYVTDGSFMPSSLGVPATATIIANALRVAAAMLEAS